MSTAIKCAVLPNGDYRQHLHLFNLVETLTYEGGHGQINLHEHYTYPWPYPPGEQDSIDIGTLRSVYLISKFLPWPNAWQVFWAEYAVCRNSVYFRDKAITCTAPNKADHSGQMKMGETLVNGPYALLLPTLGKHVIADRLVKIKHAARTAAKSELVRMFRHEDPEACGPGVREYATRLVHEKVVGAVCIYLAPYLVHPTKEMLEWE